MCRARAEPKRASDGPGGPAEIGALIGAATTAAGGGWDGGLVLLNEASAYPHGSHQAQAVREGSVVLVDVGCTVLGALTPELRANIHERGTEVLEKLGRLKDELPGYITKVQGTGLLFSCELAPEFLCYGAGSTEEWMREHGYGVIHGGANSLRFTPRFAMTSEEVDLLVEGVRRALTEGPRRAGTLQAAAA